MVNIRGPLVQVQIIRISFPRIRGLPSPITILFFYLSTTAAPAISFLIAGNEFFLLILPLDSLATIPSVKSLSPNSAVFALSIAVLGKVH